MQALLYFPSQRQFQVKTMEVVKMHPARRARISGVDLSKPVDETTRKGIAKAFDDNIVLVFRNQHLDETQGRSFRSEPLLVGSTSPG